MLVLIGILCLCMSCATVSPRDEPKILLGTATYNADLSGLKAGHAELDFDTRVRIINLNNDRAVIVTITQRIPPDPERIIHVGWMAADNIEMSQTGITPVSVEVLGRPRYPAHPLFSGTH